MTYEFFKFSLDIRFLICLSKSKISNFDCKAD